ncbi:hypothetical protein BDW72DRAFT_168148 [Aspergillus terricola var. indicus]
MDYALTLGTVLGIVIVQLSSFIAYTGVQDKSTSAICKYLLDKVSIKDKLPDPTLAYLRWLTCASRQALGLL